MNKALISREEAENMVEKLIGQASSGESKEAHDDKESAYRPITWHFGRCEVWTLLDHIYGPDPALVASRIGKKKEAIRLANAKRDEQQRRKEKMEFRERVAEQERERSNKLRRSFDWTDPKWHTPEKR